MRVIVKRDVIWLKYMHYKPNDTTDILKLDDAQDIGNNDEVSADDATSKDSVSPSKKVWQYHTK